MGSRPWRYKKASPNNPVAQYAVFAEKHKKGKRKGKRHYHAIVKTEQSMRWSAVADALREEGYYAHCSDCHDGYASGFAYCWKPSKDKEQADLDAEPFLSPAHPDGDKARPAGRRARSASPDRRRGCS
jgi:hypothetical protein